MEFGLVLSKPCCERNGNGQTGTVLFCERLLWKENGCRKGCMISVCQTKKKCPGCNVEEGTEKHRLYHCPCWNEIRSQIPEESWKWE